MNETVTTREQKQGKQIGFLQLAVSKRFGMYKDEEKKAIRAPEVFENQVLRQLRDAWIKVQWKGEYLEFLDKNYKAALAAIKDIRYTSEEVEMFSVALSEFQDVEDFASKAGYFLSALINNHPESDFTIHTGQFDGRINFLGFWNTKKITVIGDTGRYIGHSMIRGRIVIEGNTAWMVGHGMESGEIVICGDGGNYLGDHMKDGKIIVKGNIGGNPGNSMENGEITVEGNGGIEVGRYMKGGKITVKGNVKGVGGLKGGEVHLLGECDEICLLGRGGKIFHKEKLIVDK